MVAKVVDQNVIFGVVSGYILIGFIGGLLAIAVAWSFPDAFNVAGIIDGPQAMYFSFITMTTLGYGDITPAIQETRSLAILLSIVGPMYVAIIVALMVGKFAARRSLMRTVRSSNCWRICLGKVSCEFLVLSF